MSNGSLSFQATYDQRTGFTRWERMDRRTLLAVVGSLSTGGCASVLPDDQSPSDANPDSSPESECAATTHTDGGSPSDADQDSPSATADCSNATITAVSLTASTAGDTITVTGEVTRTPAPALRGYIIENACPDSRRNITIELNATGRFERTFSYAHHGIRDYHFWLEGCAHNPTSEATPTHSDG